MFKQVTQSVVHQMDPKGDLVPVHGIFDHEHFRPLCLLTRKREAIFRPSPRYKPSRYRLDDVLLPGEDNKSTESLFPNGGGEASGQFAVNKSTTDRVDGSLSLSVAPASIDVKGAASLSKGWSIKLDKKYIPLPKLEALKTVRKINVNHSFIQQLKKTRQHLYVVHEIIETSDETSCEESTMAQGSFMARIYTRFHAKGTREDKQSITITIPKGCTLAFRAIQLDIRDALWDLCYFPGESTSLATSDGSSQGKLGALKNQVIVNGQSFSNLPCPLLTAFLKQKPTTTGSNLFAELFQKLCKWICTVRTNEQRDIHKHHPWVEKSSRSMDLLHLLNMPSQPQHPFAHLSTSSIF
ncbi:gasdermin-A-like [Pelecanus crispus]|uniref:gasdermin-A-like n=1 Tax=Pelecanus crispus TaxID=36300 RepID=UPI003F5D464D